MHPERQSYSEKTPDLQGFFHSPHAQRARKPPFCEGFYDLHVPRSSATQISENAHTTQPFARKRPNHKGFREVGPRSAATMVTAPRRNAPNEQLDRARRAASTAHNLCPPSMNSSVPVMNELLSPAR